MSENTWTITLDELLFSSIPSPARNTVIEASVTVERNVGTMLSMFLGIDKESSTSFGNTAAALSFNHKINLLTDLNIIGKDEKTALIKFSEIRNIFAHNAVVTHFFQCFGRNDLKKYLEKKYGVQKSTYDFEEENCEMLFNCLYADVQQVCRNLFHKMMKKAGDQGETQGKLIYHERLLEKIEAFCKVDPDFSIKMTLIHDEAVADTDKK